MRKKMLEKFDDTRENDSQVINRFVSMVAYGFIRISTPWLQKMDFVPKHQRKSNENWKIASPSTKVKSKKKMEK